MDRSSCKILPRIYLAVLRLWYPYQIHGRWRRYYLPKRVLCSSYRQSFHYPSFIPQFIYPLVGKSDRIFAWILHPIPIILTSKLHIRFRLDVLSLWNLSKALQKFKIFLGNKDNDKWSVDICPTVIDWRLL